jgi:glycosyltransferase involved in cell wall biosynthesis
MDAEGVGSAHSASRLVHELADAGHRVTAYCPNRNGRSPSEVTEPDPDVTVELLEIDDGPPLIPQQKFAPVGERLLDRAAEFEQFDVVHSYVSAIPSLAAINDRISPPVVATLNGYGPVCPKKDLYYRDSEPCRTNGDARCAGCILDSTVTPGDAPVYDGASVFDKYDGIRRPPATAYLLLKRFQNLRTVHDVTENADGITRYHVLADHQTDIFADFGFPADRFHTVPNMLDERFLTSPDDAFEEPYQLLYVGSLIRKKGVQKLLPLLEHLNANYAAEYELTVVGDGYLQPSLEQRAEAENLDATITGRIPYEELPEIYASHDVFVYPGIWEEPFGRVFLEALATGTPVVGTRVGAVDEIVGDAGVVTDGSVRDLARAVARLSDPDELVERSRAARQQVEQYRPGSVVAQFEQFYDTAIGGTEE